MAEHIHINNEVTAKLLKNCNQTVQFFSRHNYHKTRDDWDDFSQFAKSRFYQIGLYIVIITLWSRHNVRKNEDVFSKLGAKLSLVDVEVKSCQHMNVRMVLIIQGSLIPV